MTRHSVDSSLSLTADERLSTNACAWPKTHTHVRESGEVRPIVARRPEAFAWFAA
jgi:hypothetical protein